jgi:hypothetical protein
MIVNVIEPPGEVISLVDAKKHLRVDHGDDDDYITGLVAAAVAWLDGPAGWLGRALGVQTLELVTDRFGDYCRDWLDLPENGCPALVPLALVFGRLQHLGFHQRALLR